MENCNSQRILLVLTILFITTTAVLVAIVIWMELREEKEILNETTVTKSYPGLFKTEEQQQMLFERYSKSFYYNRTEVNRTSSNFPLRSCSFSCAFEPQARRKRIATSFLSHGCCQSWVSFEAPTTLTNTMGVVRNILQYPTLKQFLIIHHCSHVVGCTGCTCTQEDHLFSAVVHKTGEDDPDDVDETEVDYFFVDGCCKCVNT